LPEFLDHDLADSFPHWRCSSGHLLPHFSYGEGEYEPRVEEQEHRLAPEHIETDALEEDALESGDEVAGRDDAGDLLDDEGHVLDGVHEAGQQERGQETGHHAGLEGEQLRPGDGGKEDAPAEGAKEEEGAEGGQQPEAAVQGDAEDADAEDEGDGHVGHAEDEVGEEFAEQQFGGADGGGEQLLHGAGFPLAGDGERGEERGDDHEDDSDQAGDDEVFGFEFVVVEDPDSRIEGHFEFAHSAGAQSLVAQVRGVCDHHGLGIAGGDRGRVGIGAIEKELDLGLLAAGEGTRVTARDDDAQEEAAVVDLDFHGAVAAVLPGDGEVARAAEALDEGAAFGSLVEIVDGGGNPVDIEGEGIAEQEQHRDRHKERCDQAADIAQNVEGLLAEDRAEPPEVHCGRASSRSMLAMKTSSMVAPGASAARSSAGGPRAIIRPRCISARRWQYSASSM